MQVQCRRRNFLENRQNKGVSGSFGLTWKLKNCANRDAMAQLKMKWRKFGGAVWIRGYALHVGGATKSVSYIYRFLPVKAFSSEVRPFGDYQR
jgi:hypothetical protein